MKNIVLHEDFLLMKYRQNAELNYEETPVISFNWMQGRRWDRPSMSTEQGSLSKISLLNFFWTSYILAFLAIICHSLNSYLRKTPKHLFPWKASRKVLVHAFKNAHTVGLHIRSYIRVLLTQELWKKPALWWEWKITEWGVCQLQCRTFLRMQVCSYPTWNTWPAANSSTLNILINSQGKGFPSYPVRLWASDIVSDLQESVSLWKASGASCISRERRCRMWWDDETSEKM